MSNILELNTDTFDRTLLEQKGKLLIVDLWADWCMPCKMIEPHLHKLAETYPDTLVIGRLNVDDHPEIAARYGVMSIPTLLFIKDGKEVDRVIGAVPFHQLKTRVEQWM